jgi:hypothetical protein
MQTQEKEKVANLSDPVEKSSEKGEAVNEETLYR